MKASEKMAKESAYQSKRQQVLAARPEDMGLALEDDGEVYAALLDFKVPMGRVCLECRMDGTVGFYYSLGGGLMNMAKKHEDVRVAGVHFLKGAASALSYLGPAMSFEPSEAACTAFLLAKNCIYRADFDTENMQEQPGHIQLLNGLIQTVLKALRAHSDE